VWLALEDEHPTQQANSFIVGCGDTEAEAIKEAQTELRKALQKMHLSRLKEYPEV